MEFKFSKTLYFIATLIAIAIFGLIGKYCGKATTDLIFNKNDEDINTVLLKIADKFNRQLPLMIDKDTECFTVTAGPRMITYSCRMVNHDVSDLDLKKFKELIQEQIKKVYCTQEGMKTFREHNVRMIYKYYDKNKEFITEVFTDNSKCN